MEFWRRRPGLVALILALSCGLLAWLAWPRGLQSLQDAVFAPRSDVPAELSPWFDRYIVVFGVHIFASAAVEDWALQHAGRVLASFLDQDEDGWPDQPAVVREMVGHKAALLLFASSFEYHRGVAKIADSSKSTLDGGVIKNDSPLWNCSVSGTWVIAELFQSEMARDADVPYGEVPPGIPFGREDASWEEIFHLISHIGFACAWPETWGFRAVAASPRSYPSSKLGVPDSNISRALDAALGSCGAAYNNTQRSRRRGCSYYYADPTCFYPCLINEYVYKLLLATLGVGSSGCSALPVDAREYAFCTPSACREGDPQGFAIASDPTMPRRLPSGHYRPRRGPYSALHTNS